MRTRDQQVGLFLFLAEKIKDYFSNDEYKIIAGNALEICREWLESKSVSEIQLYELIDSQDDDDIVCIQETAMDECDIGIWDCIIYAVAFTCKSAYEYNRKTYFPQPVEIVDFSYYKKAKSIYEALPFEVEKTIEMIEQEFFSSENDRKEDYNLCAMNIRDNGDGPLCLAVETNEIL